MGAATRFEVLAEDAASSLRAGVLHTPHGIIPTPAFMPVGTRATVKALTPADVRASGARCVLANTYHLMRIAQTIQQRGGLHAFMRWDGPILTDSGGFQLFSIGDPVELSPETAIQVQEQLGADLIMPLDVCLGADVTRAATEQALEQTQQWWRRSLAARRRDDQALFVIVQGGLFADLRAEAARAAAGEDPPGFAIGGLSVGEPASLTAAMLEATLAELPPDKPRYLMGVGSPAEVVAYAKKGVDLFDCVLPTRLARTGCVWTDLAGGRLDLARGAQVTRGGPISEGCCCLACTRFDVGALATLFLAREQLAYRLASLHNLTVLSRALDTIRTEALSVAYTGRGSGMVGNVRNL
jgi:queuine tRNA-ribosyltransferase